jgi:predicted nucleic acid-binding protein
VALSSYLDTSVVVNLLTPEPLSARAEAFVIANPTGLVVSDFTIVEFSSVIARRVRAREMSVDEAQVTFGDFDAWSGRATVRIEIEALDVAQATAFLRRLDLPLRAPDAIHIAMVQRLDATLVTFDRGMATAARRLGIAVADA